LKQLINDEVAYYKEIGNKMRETRLSHRRTQSWVGDQLDCTFQQIQKYEKGTNRIPIIKLDRLAKLYGLPFQYFISETKLLGYVKPPNNTLAKPSFPSSLVKDQQDNSSV